MIELVLLGRVLLAAALSGMIGLEREFHGRPAGLRTHLLVGIGSALVIVTFEAIPAILAQSGEWGGMMRVDPGRVAAGIITGIGFLGAGTILRVGDWVRGLDLVRRWSGDCGGGRVVYPRSRRGDDRVGGSRIDPSD